MEVDAAESKVHLWVCCGAGGQQRFLVDLDLPSLTLQDLKDTASRLLTTNPVAPDDLDVIYNAKQIKDDESLKVANVKPSSVITMYKRIPRASDTSKVDLAAASKKVGDQIPQVALALRTAFFNPNFISTIEKLGNSDMLENILAIAHGLQDDPVGIAIIQDAAMIYHLSDVESLRKLAATRPWVIEAFNFLAASVHNERGASSGTRTVPSIFQQSLFEGDGEDEDMEEDGEAGAGPNPVITREQLSAALNSLSALGRNALSSAQASQGGANQMERQATASFLDMLNQTRAQLTSSGLPAGAPVGANLPSQSSSSSLAMPPVPTTAPVNVDNVARAIAEALNRLPPEQRADQFNAIRGLASEIQNSPLPAGNTSTPGPAAAPSSSTPSNSLANQYRDQLNQMRDMGIADERLSILALRVSDGDVGTAVELIFSGWTGEGAEAEM